MKVLRYTKEELLAFLGNILLPPRHKLWGELRLIAAKAVFKDGEELKHVLEQCSDGQCSDRCEDGSHHRTGHRPAVVSDPVQRACKEFSPIAAVTTFWHQGRANVTVYTSSLVTETEDRLIRSVIQGAVSGELRVVFRRVSQLVNHQLETIEARFDTVISSAASYSEESGFLLRLRLSTRKEQESIFDAIKDMMKVGGEAGMLRKYPCVVHFVCNGAYGELCV